MKKSILAILTLVCLLLSGTCAFADGGGDEEKKITLFSDQLGYIIDEGTTVVLSDEIEDLNGDIYNGENVLQAEVRSKDGKLSLVIWGRTSKETYLEWELPKAESGAIPAEKIELLSWDGLNHCKKRAVETGKELIVHGLPVGFEFKAKVNGNELSDIFKIDAREGEAIVHLSTTDTVALYTTGGLKFWESSVDDIPEEINGGLSITPVNPTDSATNSESIIGGTDGNAPENEATVAPTSVEIITVTPTATTTIEPEPTPTPTPSPKQVTIVVTAQQQGDVIYNGKEQEIPYKLHAELEDPEEGIDEAGILREIGWTEETEEQIFRVNGTDAGQYDALPDEKIKENADELCSKHPEYAFSWDTDALTGCLKISPLPVTVTVTGGTDAETTREYNGEEQTLTYTLEIREEASQSKSIVDINSKDADETDFASAVAADVQEILKNTEEWQEEWQSFTVSGTDAKDDPYIKAKPDFKAIFEAAIREKYGENVVIEVEDKSPEIALTITPKKLSGHAASWKTVYGDDKEPKVTEKQVVEDSNGQSYNSEFETDPDDAQGLTQVGTGETHIREKEASGNYDYSDVTPGKYEILPQSISEEGGESYLGVKINPKPELWLVEEGSNVELKDYATLEDKNGHPLEYETDYTLEIKSVGENKQAVWPEPGRYKITVKGIGNYKGEYEIQKVFEVTAKATPEPTASPTPSPTPTVTPTPTPTPTPTATPTPTPEPTAIAAADTTSEPSAAPSTEPTGEDGEKTTLFDNATFLWIMAAVAGLLALGLICLSIRLSGKIRAEQRKQLDAETRRSSRTLGEE